ncbi:MAG: NADH-quinone oxidoreductase subunit M [candidate division Zixibacteria bacterium]|nr:NADH-quinone oxidoreductase subunit M [candidate division Zixibacteria bacterium]
MLSFLTFFPLLGVIVVLFLKKDNFKLIRWTAAFFSFVPMVAGCFLVYFYDYTTSAMQFIEMYEWFPQVNVNYFMGADGLSVPMLFLTGLMSFISIIASFNIKVRVKEYFAWFLLLEVGMMGVFSALDFFLFYIFWEIMLVPMYFLIGVWGGPRKEYAAIKFFLYTLFGSVFMLIGILALYFTTGTLNMMELIAKNELYGHAFQLWVFAAFFIGFAIKVPVWPFHTWLPDAHVEAPTAVSVILAAILLKMGTYGILRISYPMFPEATKFYAIYIAILGLIGIVYGALVSMAQKDLKKLVAYSSVSHMGFCMLGMAAINTVGISGCLFQMFSHGVITGALFLLVGVIYDRAHTREIAAFGGLGAKLPVYTGIFVLFGMASLGLPSMSGFVSEFMVFVGSFKSTYIPLWIVIVSVLGVILGAAYILRMVQNVFLGPLNTRWEDLTEINAREIFCVVPLAIFTILVGVYPTSLNMYLQATVENLVKLITG